MSMNDDIGKPAEFSSSSQGRMQPGKEPCAHTPSRLLGSYLTSYTVRAELPKAQGRLDTSQQGHHIQVLNPAPAEETRCVSRVVACKQGQGFE